MKEIHWFDLDNTLWKTNAKWWLLDKNNPTNPIFRITQLEAQLILNGKYVSDSNQIYYNGFTGWLSNELLTKIKQKKNIELENIGISFREYQDEKLIVNQASDLFVYIDRLKNIKTNKINLLTARANKSAHTSLINKLEESLNKINIKLNDIVFVSDPSCVHNYGSTSEKKLQCIIESLIGYKIDTGFSPMLCDSYDICHFYDDEDLNIDECKNINKRIEYLLTLTQPWLKERILNNLKFSEKKLYLNLVTTNEMNPFETSIIDIKINI